MRNLVCHFFYVFVNGDADDLLLHDVLDLLVWPGKKDIFQGDKTL